MKKVALIFPGQGSQVVGMGLDLFNNSSAAKSVFEKFNEISGKSISTLCFEGPDEELKQTINTQPCLLAVSIAAVEALREKANIEVSYFAGHSLGEYAALYSAGVLSLDDAIKLVCKRAELMSEAKGGAMSAVLNLEESKLAEVLKEASSAGTVTVANYNTPDQIVITGEIDAVAKANELASAAGAKRVIPLAVSGAFHSPLMRSAADKFEQFVSEFTFNDAKVPVITNCDAKETTIASEFASKLPEQIYSSVYWTQTVQYLVEQGVDTFIEVGSGKVLSGMVKKISREANVLNISDIQTLEKVLELELVKA